MDINKFYINGNFVEPDGSEKIDIVNPATEKVVGQVISGSIKDVDDAIKSATNVFSIAEALTLDQKKKIHALKKSIFMIKTKKIRRIICH